MLTHYVPYAFPLFIVLAGCSSLAPFLAQSAHRRLFPLYHLLRGDRPHPRLSLRATETQRPANEPRILRVWLPPQFDPNAGTESANLLQQRLADFEMGHPGLEIEVRIKAEEGEANILNALSVTSMAAGRLPCPILSRFLVPRSKTGRAERSSAPD